MEFMLHLDCAIQSQKICPQKVTKTSINKNYPKNDFLIYKTSPSKELVLSMLLEEKHVFLTS